MTRRMIFGVVTDQPAGDFLDQLAEVVNMAVGDNWDLIAWVRSNGNLVCIIDAPLTTRGAIAASDIEGEVVRADLAIRYMGDNQNTWLIPGPGGSRPALARAKETLEEWERSSLGAKQNGPSAFQVLNSNHEIGRNEKPLDLTTIADRAPSGSAKGRHNAANFERKTIGKSAPPRRRRARNSTGREDS